MLKSKIHRARVTESNLGYEGSITIDNALMKVADLVSYEMVHVYNLSNGERFSTYVIPGGNGEIGLNGAAARKGQEGDFIIIAAYTLMEETKVKTHRPKLIFVDEKNSIVRIKD
ncbi:MAG: aspartate 1-decarboxylase [Candidatus Desulfofervidus auxilii]|nr:aspartate 1-decarboxylase [Candidatus Desulfofervidus auxilii]